MYERMLQRFDEISRGRQLSVGHSQFKKNMGLLQNSPVFEQHSLRMQKRRLELQEIQKDNLLMIGHIMSPNNTVKRLELEK